jgi:3-deoxy-D-manno-octulosonic-acid transferase
VSKVVGESLLLAAYLRLAPLLAPLWRRALARRLARGKESARSVAEKLSQSLPPRPAGPVVWGHAVGVGETLALAGLFARLAEANPRLNFVLTSIARSSADALGKAALPPRAVHQFAPIDTPEAVGRFLDHWQPAAAVWCELDLWPLTITESAARGFPLVLVNARYARKDLFESDFRKRVGRRLYRALLGRFAAIFVQNAVSAAALRRLGIDSDRVRVGGNIKALAPGLRCDAQALAALQAAIGPRRCWLLASSHEGEETIALTAQAQLRQRFPDALLLIVPRYPARGPAIAQLAGGSLRSAGALPGPADVVYVADTMGELGLWYRLCPIALVGGSLVPVGGHNPWEARALGCRVLHGPQVFNFTEAYETLGAEGWAQPVGSAGDVVERVAACWAQPVVREAVAAMAPAERVDVLASLQQLLAPVLVTDRVEAPSPTHGKPDRREKNA